MKDFRSRLLGRGNPGGFRVLSMAKSISTVWWSLNWTSVFWVKKRRWLTVTCACPAGMPEIVYVPSAAVFVELAPATCTLAPRRLWPVSESLTVPVMTAEASTRMKFWVVTTPETTVTETSAMSKPEALNLTSLAPGANPVNV